MPWPRTGPDEMRLASAMLLFAAIATAGGPTRASGDEIALLPIASRTVEGTFAEPLLPAPNDGAEAQVHGILRLPAGAGRVPAVVVAHGCSGISEAETQWARRLRDTGYATLIVNSFTGRGIASVCRGTSSLPAANVVMDLYAALDALAWHPRIDSARVVALGFSTGGRAVLWAAQERFRGRYARGPWRFVAHVAFHPSSCFVRLDGEADVVAPQRIFVGRDDDWTPAAACLAWGERLRAAGRDVAVHVYPAAQHAFTNADLPAVRRVFGVVNLGACAFRERDGTLVDGADRPAGDGAGCMSFHATIGYDAAAHRRAEADVARLLADVFR